MTVSGARDSTPTTAGGSPDPEERVSQMSQGKPLAGATYHCVTLLGEEEGKILPSCQSRFAGFTETRPRREMREAAPVYPEKMLALLGRIGEVEFVGEKGPFMSGKDLILALIGEIGVGGGTNMALEFVGEGAEALSIDERLAVANMAVEAGSETGFFPADDITAAPRGSGAPNAPTPTPILPGSFA